MRAAVRAKKRVEGTCRKSKIIPAERERESNKKKVWDLHVYAVCAYRRYLRIAAAE